MDSIIKSISSTLSGLGDSPTMIYMGIGTFAGLTTNINGTIVLEPKNYHQFPPTIQDTFMKYRDMHLFIILIDPCQENPIHMSTDREMTKNIFNGNEWINITENNTETYINDRITVFPFRKNVYTEAVPRGGGDTVINITQDLLSIHQMCIENDITFVYHDFSGQTTAQPIEKFFNFQIGNHLDQFQYGFGNGSINECYFDFADPKSHIATLVEKDRHKKIIKIFNTRNILNRYEKVSRKMSLDQYIQMNIDKYGEHNTANIYGQIEQILSDFKYNFKNYSINVLRMIKKFAESQFMEQFVESQFTDNYSFIQLPHEIKSRLMDFAIKKDIRIFDECIQIFAKIYEREILLALMHSKYSDLSPSEIIYMITSGEDKYKWVDVFNQVF